MLKGFSTVWIVIAEGVLPLNCPSFFKVLLTSKDSSSMRFNAVFQKEKIMLHRKMLILDNALSKDVTVYCGSTNSHRIGYISGKILAVIGLPLFRHIKVM